MGLVCWRESAGPPPSIPGHHSICVHIEWRKFSFVRGLAVHRQCLRKRHMGGGLYGLSRPPMEGACADLLDNPDRHNHSVCNSALVEKTPSARRTQRQVEW